MEFPRVNYNEKYKIISNVWESSLPGKGSLSRFLTRLLIPVPKEQVISKNIYGFDMLLNPVIDNGVEGSLYYFGTYERGTLDFISNNLKQGDVFFDIGANIGLMSIYASLQVGNKGSVFSFEANPETAAILKYNIELNNLKNIIVVNKAVGDKNDRITLYNDSAIKNRGGASLIKPDVVSESFEVELIRLDSETEYQDMPVHMVKIDVEGFEMDVLKGMEKILRNKAPKLIIECSADRNNNYNSVYEIYDFIKKCNAYKIFKLSRTKERKGKLVEIRSKEELPKHDNIFCMI